MNNPSLLALLEPDRCSMGAGPKAERELLEDARSRMVPNPHSKTLHAGAAPHGSGATRGHGFAKSIALEDLVPSFEGHRPYETRPARLSAAWIPPLQQPPVNPPALGSAQARTGGASSPPEHGTTISHTAVRRR